MTVSCWSNFPLWFFKTTRTDGIEWEVGPRIKKAVRSPLEYVDGSRKAPGSAKRGADFLKLQWLACGKHRQTPYGVLSSDAMVPYSRKAPSKAYVPIYESNEVPLGFGEESVTCTFFFLLGFHPAPPNPTHCIGPFSSLSRECEKSRVFKELTPPPALLVAKQRCNQPPRCWAT